jgi:hypothetical protein
MSATKNGTGRTAPTNGRDREPRGEQSREDRAKPVHEIRLGRIRAAVWLNDTENGPRYNVQICRLYKDKQDKWKDSASFGRDDLPLVAKVADLAMVWMYENPAGTEK